MMGGFLAGLFSYTHPLSTAHPNPMHKKPLLVPAALAAAFVALSATAGADPNGPKDPPKRPESAETNARKGDKDPGRRDGREGQEGQERTGRGRDEVDGGPGAPRQDDGDADDALRAEESAETHEKRRDFLRKSKGQIAALLKASGRAASQAENEAIKAHWRRTMRLWRIRAIAEKLKDNETLAKVDALLAKADEKTKAKLQELRVTEGGGSK